MNEYTAVVHGLLIDGNGGEPVPDSVVVIKGKCIEAVGRADEVAIPAGTEIIDATGKSVMPGIIEGHAHVGGDANAQRVLRLTLQRGITTVCSVSANTAGIRLRDDIEEGLVRGCARLVAGCVVTCTNGHVKFRAADGPWEIRKAVREMVMAGADFIKTAASGGFVGKHEKCASPNYTQEELIALTEEAHAWEVPVIVHCHTQPGLGYCIEAGVDQIHHGAFIDEAAIAGIKEKGLFYMPTLAVTCERNIEGLADEPWQTREMKISQPIHRAGVRLARKLGVKLAVGTDYPGNPRSWDYGDRTMYEMQELVACGLSSMEAVCAATRTNADAYGRLDELGTIEAGKRADLLVVTGNPAENVEVLYEADNINIVIKDGVVESTDEEHKQHYRIREDVTRGSD
jgi:imidazolonepropionase-like amidohydrolase